MFHRSQALLFKVTPVLVKFRLHQPLPLNPHESKKLLEILQSSFRQQLDREHGPLPEQSRQDPSLALSSGLEEARDDVPRLLTSSFPHLKGVDGHINALLSNPLFTPPLKSVVQNSVRDPMELFELAVAKGMMDIDYAQICLRAKKKKLASLSVPIQKAMKESGAGIKVLKWLISSGKTNNLDFLHKEDFSKILIEYMVAEGFQEIVWGWIRKGIQRIQHSLVSGNIEDIGDEPLLTSRLLLQLVQVECYWPRGIQTAFSYIFKAAEYVENLPDLQRRTVLFAAGDYLLKKTLRQGDLRKLVISLSAFDSFVRLVPLIFHHPPPILARLKLIHPIQPSAKIALDFLRFVKATSAVPIGSELGKSTLSVGLATAKFLLERKDYDGANWVMDFIQTTFPRRLGLNQQEKLERDQAELESLEVLCLI